MNWYIPAVIAIVFLSLANVIGKLFQGKIGPLTAMFPQTLGAVLIGIIAIVGYKFFGSKGGTPATTQGILLAAAMGIVWAIGQTFFIITLSKNPPLSVVVPMVIGGIGVGGVIGGILFFSEHFTLLRVIGIILVLGGSVVLARS